MNYHKLMANFHFWGKGKWFQWDHDFTPRVNLVTWRETFKLLSTSLIFQLPVGLETAQMKGEEC